METATNNSTACTLANETISCMAPPAPRFTHVTVVKIIVLSVMFAVSLTANSAVLVCVGRRRHSSKRGRSAGPGAPQTGGRFSSSSIDLLIGNLAASDLIVTFFCNVTDVLWEITVQW